jgi:c-di-GMP-binding flagellar brake protein YcgR
MDGGQAERELKPQDFNFESMNLQVGMRLQFITYRRIKPVQYFSTLIGWVKDEYLIVKMPFDSGAPIPLTEGERLTIRVFSGVNVCSFACTVERIFGRPLLYVHLSFPTSIQGTPLRAAMRVKVDLPARIGAGQGAAPIDCLLANISVNGARIETRHGMLQELGEMTLEFNLVAPPGNQEVNVRTRVAIRNITPVRADEAQAEVFAYGLQFIDLDPVHYTLLQNLTYEALLADRQKIV